MVRPESEYLKSEWEYLFSRLDTGISGPDHVFHDFCKEGIGTAVLSQPQNLDGIKTGLKSISKLFGKYSLRNCGYFIRYNHFKVIKEIDCEKLRKWILSKIGEMYDIKIVEDRGVSKESNKGRTLILPYLFETRVIEGDHYSKDSSESFLSMLIRHLTTPPFPNAVNFEPHIFYGNILPFSDGTKISYVVVRRLTSGFTFYKPGDSKPLPLLSFDDKEEKPFTDAETTSADYFKEISEGFINSGVPVIPFEDMLEIAKRSDDVDPIEYVVSHYVKTLK